MLVCVCVWLGGAKFSPAFLILFIHCAPDSIGASVLLASGGLLASSSGKWVAQISSAQVSSTTWVAGGLFYRHHTCKEVHAFAISGTGSGQQGYRLQILFYYCCEVVYFESFSSCSLWCSYLQSDSSKDFQRHIIDMLEDAEVVSTMLIPGAYMQMAVNLHSLWNSSFSRRGWNKAFSWLFLCQKSRAELSSMGGKKKQFQFVVLTPSPPLDRWSGAEQHDSPRQPSWNSSLISFIDQQHN